MVLEAEPFREGGIDQQVDDEADPPDDAKAHQLEPIFRPTHTVHQPHVRPYFDDANLVVHGRKVSAVGGGRSALALRS